MKYPTVPFFSTHHSPVGANASLTFGAPNRGFSIDHERNQPGAEDGDLLVAWGFGPGTVRCLPFVSGGGLLDQETAQMQAAGDDKADTIESRWSFVSPDDVERILSPSCDMYSCGPLIFRVWSPYPRIPEPNLAEDLHDWTLPAVWLEADLDNSGSRTEAVVFLGFRWRAAGRMRPLAWTAPELSGVALGSQWALASESSTGAFTIRDGSVAAGVETGQRIENMAGMEGGIALKVPAGERKTLRACLVWQHHGPATQGLSTQYVFQCFWTSLESVCKQALEISPKCITAARLDDNELLLRTGGQAWRASLLAQSIRGYAANTQLLLDTDGGIHWCVLEGQYWWRNTLDLAADHLAWEQDRHPWVRGLIMKDHIENHSYHDLFPGGLCFGHDQGNMTQYAPHGSSGYERSNQRGCYSFMTLEQLLNGIYVLAAGAIDGDPRCMAAPWSDLLDSMLNRDNPDFSRRTGILKMGSDRVGPQGAEITTYDALDHSLMAACGSVYIGLKGLCAALLIAKVTGLTGNNRLASRARGWAVLANSGWGALFDHEGGHFPANALDPAIKSLVLAALDPFAMPLHYGLAGEIEALPGLKHRLEAHSVVCLSGGCRHISGGLRLSSTSDMTWPSKIILCLSVLEWLGTDLERDETVALRELLRWCQVLAAKGTIADQIRLDLDQAVGGAYYPRMVTSTLFLTAGNPKENK